MRLPLKRHYPDYYLVIQQPICLDDIKKKIDDNLYNSLDDIRQDFDLCFSNAKKYNQKNSQIWLDAKFLLVRHAVRSLFSLVFTLGRNM
jgi:hypothetical protein